MASYQDLLAHFRKTVPNADDILASGNQGGDFFNKWTGDIMADLGVATWEEIPAEVLPQYEYAGPDLGATQSAEQYLFNAAAGSLVPQIEADKARAEEAAALTAQTGDAFTGFRNTLDLATPTVGPSGELTSPLLTSQIATVNATSDAQKLAADQAAAKSLADLSQSVTAMQANLTGALAQQAEALKASVASLQSNLATLDDDQRRALASQIADQQRNLEQNIAANRQALTDEVQGLQGNTNAAAVARRTALEQQLAALNAAQAPVAAARIKAAEALVTAINVGLQGTLDQLKATQALAGYIGGSSMQDANLARATIGARQEAALTRGQADLANAADTRDIATYGANTRFAIDDAVAQELQNIANYGVQGAANLARQESDQLRAIGDTAAAERRLIANQTAMERANIGAWEAGATLENANQGIAQQLAIQQGGVTGGLDITNTQTQQQQEIANQKALAEAAARDAVFPTAVTAGQLATTLPAEEAAAKTALIPYATVGTRNALDTFNWFSNTATPPEPTVTLTQPSTAGSDYATLGANLAGAAFQLYDPKKQTAVTKPSIPPALSLTGPTYGSASGVGQFRWGTPGG